MDATLYVWCLVQICVNISRTYTVESAPAVIGSLLCGDSDYYLAQCIGSV